MNLYMLRRFWVVPVVVMVALTVTLCDAQFDFKAIFNFGDSNSDTGGFLYAFPGFVSTPYNGMTYFKGPSGRASDGRLVIDFIAERLRLPFLSPYLQSIRSDYKYGANFASVSARVLYPLTSLFVTGAGPFPLPVQLNQLKNFKAKVDELNIEGLLKLPPPDVFGKSLYTMYIGQNDFISELATNGIDGVKKITPQVISQITSTIREVHGIGGRTFFIQNLGPIGCYPAFLVTLPRVANDTDEFGCVISYNKAVVEYNNMFRGALNQIRKELSDAIIIYVDYYKALLELFQNPTSHGLKYTTLACCGTGGGQYNYNPQVFCGTSAIVDGQNVTAFACSDPQNYVNWDGIHATDAANKFIANALLGGGFTDPPFNISY